MRNKILTFLLACISGTFLTPVSAVSVTDMAGREVEIPEQILRVIPYDNKTNAILYPVAGEKMVARAFGMGHTTLRYISGQYLHLKEVDCQNMEEVIKLRPDIIVLAIIIQNKMDLEMYEALSEKTKIPLIIVDLKLRNMDKSIELLGSIMNKQEEAASCSKIIQKIYHIADSLKETRTLKQTSYLANGTDGLRSAPANSTHAEVFREMGIPYVTSGKLDNKGFTTVSMEQILLWNPDYIFCMEKDNESNPYRTINKSGLWKNISAVQNKRVYFIPSEPYPWIDMPPSINRLLGMVWFGHLFYGYPEEKLKETVQQFYRVFYQYELNNKEYINIFKWG